MEDHRTYTTIETIERKAIEGLLARMHPAVEGIIKSQLIRSLANGLALLAQQKQEIEELNEYTEQVVAKGDAWGTW